MAELRANFKSELQELKALKERDKAPAGERAEAASARLSRREGGGFSEVKEKEPGGGKEGPSKRAIEFLAMGSYSCFCFLNGPELE